MHRRGLAVLFSASLVALAVWVGGAAAATSLPLTARLIKTGEFAGYTASKPNRLATAKAWVGANLSVPLKQREAQTARLKREGFKGGLAEFLNGPQGPHSAVSTVMQLGSNSSARSELAGEFAMWSQIGNRFTKLSVKAVPGAVGWTTGNSTNVQETLLFADGPFLYQLSFSSYRAVAKATYSLFIEAAMKLYTRVHGH